MLKFIESPKLRSQVISYCVSNRRRSYNTQRLIDSLLKTRTKNEIIVADWDNPSSLFNCKVIKCSGRFSTAIGKNIAAKNASGDILVFLDSDIIVPKGFDSFILRNVQSGQCFFPICFALGKDGRGGFWKVEGYGICAFMRADFSFLRWNESFVGWGKEDPDIFCEAKKRFRVVREKVDGLFHIWHPRNRDIDKFFLGTIDRDEVQRFIDVCIDSHYTINNLFVGEQSDVVKLLQDSNVVRKISVGQMRDGYSLFKDEVCFGNKKAPLSVGFLDRL